MSCSFASARDVEYVACNVTWCICRDASWRHLFCYSNAVEAPKEMNYMRTFRVSPLGKVQRKRNDDCADLHEGVARAEVLLNAVASLLARAAARGHFAMRLPVT